MVRGAWALYRRQRMLAYLARTLPVLAGAALSRERSRVSRIERRVRLRDIDLFGHMNQAVYAQVMELGRGDWLIRSGALGRWRGQGLSAMVAAQHIVYRRELKPLAAYTIDTRALELRGRLLRFQTLICVGRTVHARNDTDIIFVGPDGVLGPEQARAASEGLLAAALVLDDWRIVEDPER